MRMNFRLHKDFISSANKLAIKIMATFLMLFLCVGISPAWGAEKSAKIGAIFYVDASAPTDGDGMSWETGFTGLHDALDIAVSGDQIWVAAGTYKPTSSTDRSVSFVLKSGVKIYGGFAGDEKALRERSLDPSLTVLSGDIGTENDDTDNSYHVVYADGVTDAVLDGFTVTRGHGDGGSKLTDYKGGGIHTLNSAFTVSNCIFSNNKVALTKPNVNGAGGGMYNKNSALTVTNCIFSENQAGNAAINSYGSGGGMYNEGYFNDGVVRLFSLITGCTFRDNLASSTWDEQYGGGGMYNGTESYPIIDRCIFERNLGGLGGGMLNYQSRPIITNCIFNTNSNSYVDGYGGAIYNFAVATILNCTFYQNGWRLLPSGPEPRFKVYTAAGGAVYDRRAPSTIFNCIFSNNAGRNFGGAIVSATGTMQLRGTTVINSLFYENITWNGRNNPSYEEISHTQGNFHPDSAGNLYDIDPRLVDPEAGDFHLSYDSPGIDAGYALTFGYLPHPYPFGLPSTDFEGDKRIVDSDGDGVRAIDIGADEVIPNIPDLGWFIQSLAETGEIEQAVANSLLVYVDAAQAALDREDEQTAINLLNDLIAEAWDLLEDTETAQVIEMKTEAVIEEI
jgi:hypothetical protein